MKKSELDQMLKQWAQDTAPGTPTLTRLHSCISTDVARPMPSSSGEVPVHFGCTPWMRILAQAACAALLLAVGLVLWVSRTDHELSADTTGTAPRSRKLVWALDRAQGRVTPMLAKVRMPHGQSLPEEIRQLGDAFVVPGPMQHRQLAVDLHVHMVFLEVSQMPGLAGPYRPDTLLMLAIPCDRVQWLAMTPLVWEVLIRDN